MAGDGIPPSKVQRPRLVICRGPLTDPLGYDTADIRQVAIAMADAAESGRNRDAVCAEIRAVERRLGDFVTVEQQAGDIERAIVNSHLRLHAAIGVRTCRRRCAGFAVRAQPGSTQ
jgi:hypothetical protein